MANARKAKSLRKVGEILTKFPEKVGQVSTSTLQQIPLTGPTGITIKKELGTRATSGDYEHSFRTKRPKPANG